MSTGTQRSTISDSPSTHVVREQPGGFTGGGVLRPSSKALPGHGRGHNRSLVLQVLYAEGGRSRADIARQTGLTRVTVSDLVAELIGDGLVVETGQRDHPRPGKPATLLDIDRSAFQIIGLDLSAHASLRGAVLDLDGTILIRAEEALAGATGADATAKVVRLAKRLLAASTAPVLGVGVGSPGVVDPSGVIVSAPNLGWEHEPLQSMLRDLVGVPVTVANDANAAALAEHGFGGAGSDMMLVKIGHGVGAGLLLGGALLLGSRFSAGEIGHVVVGTDGGAMCACGRLGCLETWLSTPRLDASLAAASPRGRAAILATAGERLGIALSPVVGALGLAEIVLSGPAELIAGVLADSTLATIRRRTAADVHGDLTLRMSLLGDDIVVRGAAVMVLSAGLGVS